MDRSLKDNPVISPDTEIELFMKMNAKIDKFIAKVLNKLFQDVGFKKFDKVFVDKYKYDWYVRKTWTAQQEGEFKDWFTKACQKDLGMNKKLAEKEWGWFNLNYGWKVKD